MHGIRHPDRRKSASSNRLRTSMAPDVFYLLIFYKYPACRATFTLPSWKRRKRKKALPTTSTTIAVSCFTALRKSVQKTTTNFETNFAKNEIYPGQAASVFSGYQPAAWAHKIVSNLTNYTCVGVLTCLTGLSRQRNWHDWHVRLTKLG